MTGEREESPLLFDQLLPVGEDAHMVRDMDMLTAWRSPKWQQLRAWQAAGLLKQCRGCTINQADTHSLDRLHDGLAELSCSSLPRH